MATLNDINKQAKTGQITTFTDPDFPAGFFVGVTTHQSNVTFFVFKGENGDPEAPIVGRLESPLHNPNRAFKGDGVEGGEEVATSVSFIEAVLLITK